MFMKLIPDPPDLVKAIHCISRKHILRDLLQFTDRIYGTVRQNFKNILQLWKLLNLLISIIILTPEIKNVLVLQMFSYMHVYNVYMYPILYIYFSCVLYVYCFLYYTDVCIYVPRTTM